MSGPQEMEIPLSFERALRVIHACLADLEHPWGITGSLGMRLQGMPLAVRDIDLQSDQPGAYAIQERLAASPECAVTLTVAYLESANIRSHFGRLEIAGVKVEVMGDIANRLPAGGWSVPPELAPLLRRVTYGGMALPVLDLEYEYRAYQRMGRLERAAEIHRFLLQQKSANTLPRINDGPDNLAD
jgi:hypothetical protein